MQDDFDFMGNALAAAAAEDWHPAFGYLRWVFRDQELAADDKRFVESVKLLAGVGGAIAGDDFRKLADAAATFPDDTNALNALGWELSEHQLFEIAASVFSRTNRLAPGDAETVAELVHALEGDCQNAAACVVLVEQPGLLEEHNLFRYLLAFNSIMSGDLPSARRILPSLDRDDDDSRPWAERIEAMVGRADEVGEVCKLDKRDLRGWHYVLNGGLLLHVSPYGFNKGMTGRYAFIQDSPGRCRHGILRLQSVLEATGFAPKQVVSLPDRESQILATAAAKMLNLRLVTWKPQAGLRRFSGPQEGLIVGYDLAAHAEETLVELDRRHPRQLLFIHATCWTEPPPVCPDYTTYLYEANNSPWGEHLQLDPDTRKPGQVPPDTRPVKEIASAIVDAEEDDGLNFDADADADDCDEVEADSLDRLIAEAKVMPIANLHSGKRSRVWEEGPVKSSRFG